MVVARVVDRGAHRTHFQRSRVGHAHEREQVLARRSGVEPRCEVLGREHRGLARVQRGERRRGYATMLSRVRIGGA